MTPSEAAAEPLHSQWFATKNHNRRKSHVTVAADSRKIDDKKIKTFSHNFFLLSRKNSLTQFLELTPERFLSQLQNPINCHFSWRWHGIFYTITLFDCETMENRSFIFFRTNFSQPWAFSWWSWDRRPRGLVNWALVWRLGNQQAQNMLLYPLIREALTFYPLSGEKFATRAWCELRFEKNWLGGERREKSPE